MYSKVILVCNIILKALVCSAQWDQMINYFINFQAFTDQISKEYFENSCSHIDSNVTSYFFGPIDFVEHTVV